MISVTFFRAVLSTFIFISCILTSFSSSADTFPLTVTDIAGRTITIDSEPQKIALSSGRVFPLLEIIYQKDAAKHLVAWRDDMRLSAPSMYQNYIKDYPGLKNIMTIGKIKSAEFDAERFINMSNKPDLFVVDLSNIKLAQDKGLLEKLEKAGIKVLAIDFREHPVKNTVQSITSLATALGRKAQGQRFADYYQEHITRLTDAVASLPVEEQNKTVFIERAAGYSDSCCRTFSEGNMGAYIPLLKAKNIAEKPLQGAVTGQMSPESVIIAQPDIYIMQTTGWLDKEGNVTAGIPLGYSPIHNDAVNNNTIKNQAIKNQAIKKSTTALMARSWLKATKAYQDKNIYSIYMPFYNSPYNLVAMEYFAKWIHPQQFKDLNPLHTFEEMNQRFADRTASGVFGQNNVKAMQ
ncbi:cobalamin ABC transporter substrate-binding protein [Psychromonas sp. MB-3u-54]|uniref:ABC transporter substrate-binding protein n=1 Tax=Psychromonas sp. MB-3u-54 TaxID=2058319 RepID=UPI000C34C09F|nr:ABC transporter substrate-binding protein [Psychromonas sp. MB-3u-54]PKH03656.1 cobalamin ABC transporter substrate-binding protein [Psychromonas sp. MB-3u-54]